jgi:hypothetical protein
MRKESNNTAAMAISWFRRAKHEFVEKFFKRCKDSFKTKYFVYRAHLQTITQHARKKIAVAAIAAFQSVTYKPKSTNQFSFDFNFDQRFERDKEDRMPTLQPPQLFIVPKSKEIRAAIEQRLAGSPAANKFGRQRTKAF